jgi:hypothetical protein
MLRLLATLAVLTPWPAPPNPMALAQKAGLVPEVNEHLDYHVHSHLDVFVNGKKVRVPAGIGIDIHGSDVHPFPMGDGSVAYGGITRCKRPCISPLHTHDDTGILHTETSTPTPNTLGQFFVEWGVRLGRTCVGGYCRRVRFWVNGKPYTKDPRSILLADRTEIAIVVGTPPRKIPSRFPTA